MINQSEPQYGFESPHPAKVENQPIANTNVKSDHLNPQKFIQMVFVLRKNRLLLLLVKSKAVSREKQPSSQTIKRTEQNVNTFEQVSLNDIGRHTSSKVEDRLRRDERKR